MGHREKGHAFRVLIHPVTLFAVAASMVFAFALLTAPPRARGFEATPDTFSADRALATLRGLLAESQPHVAGSELNRVVRGRIEKLFEAEGYKPEIQSRFHCNPPFGSCATVENIIAVKPGSDGRKSVLLTAHYDSAWAGPGAADDGAGVAAVIEISRMAAEYADFRNDIIFLLTDGEEQGLIGAHAFAEYHPLFNKVAAVINLEARGVTGPSTMFETGDGNRSIIRILSKNVERPVANSLAYELYRRMPNDTDYSVYRERGVMGLNFAFTGGVALYHSRLDTPDYLDPGSLQHHGQNAWALVVALAERDISRLRSREDAAYIDVFGRLLWHYPESIATGVTMLLTVLVLLGIVLRLKEDIRPAALAWAFAAQVMLIAMLAAGAWVLNWPLARFVVTHPIEHPNPWVARCSIFALCVLVVWVTGKLFAHRVTFGAATLVCWMTIAALGFWLDFELPSASFVAVIPLFAFFLGMLLDLLRWRSWPRLVFATLFGFTAAAYMALYHFFALDAVLGFDQTHLKALPLVLMLLPALPVWFSRYEEPVPDWLPLFLLGGLVAATALLHLLVPGISDDRPRGMNLVYREVPGEVTAQLYLESAGGGIDEVYADSHGFAIDSIAPPYASRNVTLNPDREEVERPAVELPAFGLPALAVSEVTSERDELRSTGAAWRHRFTARPAPDCRRLVLAWPEDAELIEVRVNGVLALNPEAVRKTGEPPRTVRIAHPGVQELQFDLFTRDNRPLTIAATSRFDLPEDLAGPYLTDWPSDAQPIFRGSRAESVQEIEIAPD